MYPRQRSLRSGASDGERAVRSTILPWPRPSRSALVAVQTTAPWRSFVLHPHDRLLLPAFTSFVYMLVITGASASLTSLIADAVGQISTPLVAGGCRKAVISILLVAHGILRLRVPARAGLRPRWFLASWRAVPPWLQHSIEQCQWPWFQEYVALCTWDGRSTAGSPSIVYMLFGHGGQYIGKADAVRRQGSGLQWRASEHIRALLQPFSEKGKAERYIPLRRSHRVSFLDPLVCRFHDPSCPCH